MVYLLDNSGGIRGSNGYQETVSGDRQLNVVQFLTAVVLAVAYRWFGGEGEFTNLVSETWCLSVLINSLDLVTSRKNRRCYTGSKMCL